ncbi:MAG: aldo/keto reductase [Armatimonadetes bacterium]|nr:aldo/keto reductase [Armatimonadota bacterium]
MLEKRICGGSGLSLSVLGIGCWSFGGGSGDYWGPQDQGDVDAVVRTALDRGVNYFDTAEGYNGGRSEESLGRALQGRRHEAIIGSKISPTNTEPETLRRHCEASLRRLQTDVIDIYMVHWPIPAPGVPDAFAALQALQAEGKIRAIGVSNFGVAQMTEALATGARIGANQLCYNILSRAIEIEILPLCRERRVGVLGYMPLQQGILTGKYRSLDEAPPARLRTRHFRGDRPGSRHGQTGEEDLVLQILDGIRRIAERLGVPMGHVALAWTFHTPGITSVLAGIRNLAQLEDNLAAAALMLPPEIVAELDALSDPLKQRLGPNADYFAGEARRRTR